jgi:DNA-binding helix-hairpin-helix protein with protein kinase domain
MPKISGWAPIHMLYGPAHRRQKFSRAAWDFLLFAARNTAAAIAAIHQHGHVVGDVNQGNILVGADSRVVLIDTDSFQVVAHGTTHLCKVGVAHFTPPELQETTVFERTPRTSNHDNFGLALLVFHLLFGGRHPYSGVPIRPDAGDALEKDIQAYRYAYARDGKQRGFNPPPKSIPIHIVPEPIEAMFTHAFTECGAQGNRPTAQQWVAALDDLRKQLKRCASKPMHIYPGHLGRCPWCVMENHGVIYFMDVHAAVTTTKNSGFILARVWAAIAAIPPPPDISIPSLSTLAAIPTPLPQSCQRRGPITSWRVVIVGLALLLIRVLPGVWFFVLGGACFAWAATGNLGGAERKAERAKRQAASDAAQQEYEQIVRRVKQEVNPQAFAKKKQDLARLRDEYQHLSEREKTEIANLYATAEARQKQRFLERYFLDDASISGIGSAKKAALKSFGIETAADVTWNKVIAVKGFGEVLTLAVVGWRTDCERRFVFNPNLAVTQEDKNVVRAKIAARRQVLEITLNVGAAELQRMRQEMLGKANVLSHTLQGASKKLAQAQADLNAM